MNSCVLLYQDFKPSHVLFFSLWLVQNPYMTPQSVFFKAMSQRASHSEEISALDFFFFFLPLHVSFASIYLPWVWKLCLFAIPSAWQGPVNVSKHFKLKVWKFTMFQVCSSENMPSCAFHHLSIGPFCASYILSLPIISAANRPGVFPVTGRSTTKSCDIMLNTWREHSQFICVSSSAALCRARYVDTNTSIFHYVDEVRSSKTHLESPINMMAALC